MKISDLIRTKRKEMGLTQRALARRIGLNPSAIAQWELGDTIPTNENMAALRVLLRIDSTIEPSPTAPYGGKLVDDPDELAWLRLWNSMDRERRIMLTELLRSGLPSKHAA